jgi:predicted glycogen debranching enzyme
MIEFSREVCADLAETLRREWLETNGIGGFASSSVAGVNTRRYHGLLVAATRPPVGRLALLSKLEETLVVDGRRYDLSANQYPGVVHPQGHQYLSRFRLDPFPIFTYSVDGVELEKSVFMIQGENSTVVQYSVRSNGDARRDLRLEVRPLVAFRDYHSTTHENGALNPEVMAEGSLLTLRPYEGLPALHLAHDADEVARAQWWNRNLEYAAEQERGLDFREDLFSPLALKFDLSSRTEANVIASTERRDARDADEYRRAEIARRESVLASAPSGDELVRPLTAAADQYIAARAEGKTIIAGYHWFSDWGRDTMIALPGLTLVTGRADVARSILLEFARHVDRGMLPNRFPDAGEAPEYNTVDATLWFFEAVRAFLHYTGDYEFVRRNLYGVLREIVGWHERGTRYRIHTDEDGLLFAGEEGVQLTWMDARVGGREITPRTGKAVEIQALWYNALRVVENLAREFGLGEDERKFGAMAARARESFGRLFWNEDAGCLFDVVNGDARDGSIRPNQIIAASLTHSMLAAEKARRVVETVERKLLTPFGLRSLAPSDPQYHGRYEGGPESRDGVYHQGTVWAWLLGPFITAYVKAHGRSAASRRQAARWLAPLAEHLSDAGLGHVSEIFDGDAPHRPRGCVAQAWSVAELLRAAAEDVFADGPAGQRHAAYAPPPVARATPPPAHQLSGQAFRGRGRRRAARLL